MLEVEVLGLKYHRLIFDNFSADDTINLKTDYDYSFLVSYGKFNDNSYETVYKNTLMLDLNQGIDTLFSKFKPTVRNEIRRSEKIDGLKFHYTIDNFETFYKFYSDCEHDRGWYPVPETEIKNSIIIYCSYNDVPISGMSGYTHGNKMRIGRIFSVRRSIKMDQPNLVYGAASKRIVFDFCKYAIEKGYESLDLGGVDLNTEAKSGISDFKLSFGGELKNVTIGRYMNAKFKAALPAIKEAGYDIT
jgi:hypothetical protein